MQYQISKVTIIYNNLVYISKKLEKINSSVSNIKEGKTSKVMNIQSTLRFDLYKLSHVPSKNMYLLRIIKGKEKHFRKHFVAMNIQSETYTVILYKMDVCSNDFTGLLSDNDVIQVNKMISSEEREICLYFQTERLTL